LTTATAFFIPSPDPQLRLITSAQVTDGCLRIDLLSDTFPQTRAVDLKQTNYPPFGQVIKQDALEEPLYFRDMTNKIMHSSAIEWQLSDSDNPIIICHSPDPPRWLRAEIQLLHLAAHCGGLMS
jgi:hypothetical protein